MSDETEHTSRRERRYAAERALEEAAVDAFAATPPLRSRTAPRFLCDVASPTFPELASTPAKWAPIRPEQPSEVPRPLPAELLAEPVAPATVAELEPLPTVTSPELPVVDDGLTPAEEVVLAADDNLGDEMSTALPAGETGTVSLGWESEEPVEADGGAEAEAQADSEQPLTRRQKREAKPKLTRKERKAERLANRRWWRPILDFVLIVIAAALVAALIKAVAFRTFEVPSESMNPTLMTNDRIVVELITPHFDPYKRGDVVVFKDPDDWIGDGPDKDEDINLLQLLGLQPESTGYIVKRILAVPGETIEGKADGTILINGEVLENSYAPRAAQDPFTWTLSEGEYWMMGDNRAGSADSRVHGPVDEDEFVGRVAFLFFPFDRIGEVN